MIRVRRLNRANALMPAVSVATGGSDDRPVVRAPRVVVDDAGTAVLAWHRAWGWYADDELRTRRVRADGTLGVTAGVASNIFGTDLDADSAGNVSFVWTASGGVSSTRRRSVSGSMTAAEELSR